MLFYLHLYCIPAMKRWIVNITHIIEEKQPIEVGKSCKGKRCSNKILFHFSASNISCLITYFLCHHITHLWRLDFKAVNPVSSQYLVALFRTMYACKPNRPTLKQHQQETELQEMKPVLFMPRIALYSFYN